MKFVPDNVKLQFAGGIGFISIGAGYTFFNEKLDISYFYGYVPSFVSVDDLHSLSIQLFVKPFRIPAWDGIEVFPLNFGVFFHHTFGNEYWIRLPSHYPKDYYWWSPGRNAGAFLGGEIKTGLLKSRSYASGASLYFRFGSRGLYLASKLGNSSIPVSDIIEFGFGVILYR
ncbi:hypothetical protein MASR2M12_01090 [Bacteroidales bacterium]